MAATIKGPYNYIAGSGISVGVVLNTSTGQFDVTVTNTSPSSGGTVTSVGAGTGISVTGTSTSPVVNVAASGVTGGTYGDSSHYPTFTVDATGRVTAASQVALPSGPGFAWVTAGGAFEAFGTVLGGDVSQGTHSLGVQPMIVGGLKGSALPALPGTDQYLHYTGSAWAFSSLPTAPTASGGAGISVTGGPAYTIAIAAATAHSVMTTGAGSGGFTAIVPGATGTYLRSNGASADVSFQDPIVTNWNGSPGNTITVGHSIVEVVNTTATTNSTQWLNIVCSFMLNYDEVGGDVFIFGVGIDSNTVYSHSRSISGPNLSGGALPIAITPTFVWRTQPGSGSHTIYALCNLNNIGVTGQGVDADLLVFVTDN